MWRGGSLGYLALRAGGKFICLIYVLALVAVLVGGAIFKSGSDKGDRKEED